MKKQERSTDKKSKKSYEKPVLTRYEKLTSVIAGNGTNGYLGCTRF